MSFGIRISTFNNLALLATLGIRLATAGLTSLALANGFVEMDPITRAYGVPFAILLNVLALATLWFVTRRRPRRYLIWAWAILLLSALADFAWDFGATWRLL